MLLIILGVIVLFFIKRRRQNGRAQPTPSSPQTQEAPERTWPVYEQSSSNLPYDPYDVSSPLFFLSAPPVTVAPWRFIFSRALRIRLLRHFRSATGKGCRLRLTSSLPTDLMINVRVDTLICRRCDRVIVPCHRGLTINSVGPGLSGIISSSVHIN